MHLGWSESELESLLGGPACLRQLEAHLSEARGVTEAKLDSLLASSGAVERDLLDLLSTGLEEASAPLFFE